MLSVRPPRRRDAISRDSGRTRSAVPKIAGHSDLEMTGEYIFVSPERQNELTRLIKQKLRDAVGKNAKQKISQSPVSISGVPALVHVLSTAPAASRNHLLGNIAHADAIPASEIAHQVEIASHLEAKTEGKRLVPWRRPRGYLFRPTS